MMKHLETTTLLYLLASLPHSRADNADLPSDLVGCQEVSCPGNDSTYHCSVGGDTYTGIGLARIPEVPSALDGLSLVKGVEVSSNPDKTGWNDSRAFKSVYYLGTPDDLDVRGLNGCAVLFNDPPSKKFRDSSLSKNGTEREAAPGTCPDVIEQGCIDALTHRASSLSYSVSADACRAIDHELKTNTIDQCADLGGRGKGLGNFSVVSLDDVSPITQSQNSSANCWPILPKTDDLARITEDTVLADYSAGAVFDQLLKITPVLTVFFPGNGNNNLVNQTSAQLTCLKVVHKMDYGDYTVPGAASLLSYSRVGAGLSVLLGVIFLAV